MHKKCILLALLAHLMCTEIKSMEAQNGIIIPTAFHLKTALDNISVPKICQTLTWAAGISLLYKATDSWAKSFNPYADLQQPNIDSSTRSLISRSRRKASLHYLIAGCAFTTAGFLQKYSSHILRHFKTFFVR